MIAVLYLVGSDAIERLIEMLPEGLQPRLRRLLRVAPPLALGSTFEEE